MTTDEMLLKAVKEGIYEALKARLVNYNSPVDILIRDCIKVHESALSGIINQAVSSCVLDQEFKEEIKTAVRTQLARALVQRMGGELEKQVNQLKADPTTRARIVMAIDRIINNG